MILKSPGRLLVGLSAVLGGCAVALSAERLPDEILLKDYKPRSIFKIPETRVEKAPENTIGPCTLGRFPMMS